MPPKSTPRHIDAQCLLAEAQETIQRRIAEAKKNEDLQQQMQDVTRQNEEYPPKAKT